MAIQGRQVIREIKKPVSPHIILLPLFITLHYLKLPYIALFFKETS